jgi:CDP-diacylglycerol--serine O-phosphatidyltransferase
MGLLSMKPDTTQNPDPQNDSRQVRRIGLHRMIPNMITLTAMAAGLTAIQYGLNGLWEKALLAILLAAILDVMDGATARLLKATSDFGAQLDSLSDFMAFGVAPSIILYSWILNESGKLGWVAMIFYTSATALRLARFNTERKLTPKWQAGFFSGVPSPAGAGLALLPMVLWFQDGKFFSQFAYASPLVGLWTICVAMMMVSRIPTFSVKAIKIPAKMGMMIMAGAALLIAALVTMTWQTLTLVAIVYLASIPFSFLRYRRLEKDNHIDNVLDEMQF